MDDWDDLLAAVSDALEGMADWRAVAVRSAVDRVRAGADEPNKAADDLRDLMATRRGVTPTETP